MNFTIRRAQLADADFQCQGAGRKLLLMAVEHARDRALYGLTLTTFRELPWNEPFYQRMGFGTLSRA